MSLSGNDIDNLASEIASAVDDDELERIVHSSTGDRLHDKYVGTGYPKEETIKKLLDKLEHNGTTDFFLAEVWSRKPMRGGLRDLILNTVPTVSSRINLVGRQIDLSAQSAGQEQQDAPPNALAPGFEKNLRPLLPQLDVHLWVEKLLRIERQICRIERDGVALGTGFLVGEDLVLTNWHVVHNEISRNNGHELTCRFDYVRKEDDVALGIVTTMAKSGCIAFSTFPIRQARGAPSIEPTLSELDYALLKLDTSPGNDQLGDSRRSWITLTLQQHLPEKNEPLLIVQHPLGAPMKLALDTQAITGMNALGTRIQYKTNTEPGSSGSPCFTLSWRLIALHNSTTTLDNPDGVNQGTPIHLVAKDVKEKLPDLVLS
ncbi:serine protease [Sinorhizobium sp. M4_45]|uniref:trypsin-like serine peptidase n=1 Tax=Sinorhizobium sp. M4_45 TaxID=2037901 RepID=UPI000C999B16|nr:serine protease [Sinorhizobium sp. M4_45]PND27628.1 hypothetical protein CN933_05740 [Sinorhizobium sp. M4_45]